MSLDNVYPVEFKLGNNIRYGLWMAHENGDFFLKNKNGKIISLKCSAELNHIAKNFGLNLKSDEPHVIDMNIISRLIKFISHGAVISSENCSILLDFLNVIQDITRTLGEVCRKDEEINRLAIKLFHGCDIPSLGNKIYAPFFDNHDIDEFNTILKNGRKLIIKNFWNK